MATNVPFIERQWSVELPPDEQTAVSPSSSGLLVRCCQGRVRLRRACIQLRRARVVMYGSIARRSQMLGVRLGSH